MLTLDRDNMILWEAESIINNIILKQDKNDVIKLVEQYMQDEAYYGDPDYSYY